MPDDVKFGTSGLRGLARDLERGAAHRHALAFCLRLRETSGRAGAIYLGRDRRESSQRIAAICSAAARSAGLRAVDCGLLPTPALALHAMACGEGAIMITGSHIPADRNGLKFYAPGGEIDKADEAAIAALAASRSDPAVPQPGKVENDSENATERFLRRYRDHARRIPLAGRRIGIWAHSSVASGLLETLISLTGAEPVVFGATREFVPVDTEALPATTRELLAARARELRLDAIVSTDADGDRPLVADQSGRQLPGDLVAFAAALAGGADAIALPVTCNSAIGERFAGRLRRTRIGSPYVLAAMAELRSDGAGAVAGFEANGGLMTESGLRYGDTVYDRLPTRDSFLPILATLAHLADPARQMGAMAAEFGFRPAAADRLPDYPAAHSGRLVEELVRSRDLRRTFTGLDGEIALGDRTDGIALVGPAGETVRVRASGNAPELRVYVETATAGSASRILAHCLGQALAYRDGRTARP
jgi:phosphomannomutase